MFTSTNPSDGTRVATHAEHEPAEVELRLQRAADTSAEWRRIPVAERAAALVRLGAAVERHADDHAALITREMGKPLAQARAELEKCAWACRHYAEHGERYLAPEQIETEAAASYVRHDPLGAVFAIMPWNFPFWQVFRFLAPTTVAGNVVLLKHAPTTMGCGEAVAALVDEAGFPDGVVQTLRITHDAAARVIADPRVHGVTFTGSTRGGRAIAELSGRSGKRAVLELGGSDAVIVLDDADVAAAARGAATSRLLNAGQSCIAAKRFVVQRAVAQEFTEAVRAIFEDTRVGDPLDPATDVGPLARDDLRAALASQVERSVAAGARMVVEGGAVDGPGFFYRPALLTDVHTRHAVGHEETFGPVAAISVVDDDSGAVALANDTEYGLAAGIWTADLARAERMAAHLDVGAVSINDAVRSDPRMPFGGVKASGYGRELGVHGIMEFTNAKSIWAAQPG